MTGTLGCVEQCLFGALEDKLDLLEELGLWLELANTGPRDTSPLKSYSVRVKTVQAYMLHKLHWLSPEKKMHKAACEHILDTIKMAEDIGADHVLTVPTYGFYLADDSRQLCVQNFRSISKETNLVILIEALSPKKTKFLPSLPAVAELVDEINRDNVRLAADTWHIQESDFEAAEMLGDFDVIELHLRDTNSTPPGQGIIDFRKIIKALSPQLLCFEFNAGTKMDLIVAYKYLKPLISN
jgi:sugar phosphate isomerase/epimerase